MFRDSPAVWVGLCILCLVLPAALAQAEPRLALVLDTSGSMADNDPHRYAVHFAKVIARTLGDGVGITALYGRGAQCSDGEAAVGTVRLDAADPPAFDRALEDGVRYAGGNRFGPPIARARALLAAPAAPAALVILADGGGRSAAERRTSLDAEIRQRVALAGGRHDDVDVRVSLKWNTIDDLDLHVMAPCGDLIYFSHQRSRDGGVLDVDRNVGGGGTREPVENTRWAKGQAPTGTYRVMVQNYAFHEGVHRPIDYVVEIVNGAEINRYTGTLTSAGETRPVAEFRFDPNRPAAPVDTGAAGADPASEAAALNPTPQGCPDPWVDLTALKGTGITLASVAMGGNDSPFAGHPLMGSAWRIGNPAELAATAAALAKAAFGRDRLSAGAGTGRVEVPVPEHTGQVWLLVTADGALSDLRPSPLNPSGVAVKMDEAAGETRSAEGRGVIGYRVIRLVEPAAGTWRFETAAGLALGWLVETRGLLGLRLVEPPALYRHHETKLVLEVFDPRTGAIPTDPALLRSLRVEVSVDDAAPPFNDGGQPPDPTAGDGRFSGVVTPLRTGLVTLKARLHYDGMQREQAFPLPVADLVWRWRPALPATHRRDLPLLVSGTIEPADTQGPPPTSITATAGELVLHLRDDGGDGDLAAGDGLYSARWTPTHSGAVRFTFAGQGGGAVEATQAAVTVVDWALLKGPDLLDFGVLGSRTEGQAVLDLSASSVHGEVPLVLTAQGVVPGLTLELADGSRRRRLTAGESVDLMLGGTTNRWRLYLTAPRCPPTIDGGETGSVQVRTRSGEGPDQRLALRVRVATQPLPWFICLLPFLILGALLLLAAFIVWGFVSPARFPRTLGVVLSPEEDMNEGFFQLVRARKGTGSGFYRDARCFITPDFRLSGRRNGALVGLVAGRPRPRLKLLDGQAILRCNPTADWVPLGETETLVQFGELYRNEAATLYFEFRNA